MYRIWLEVVLYATATFLVAAGLWSWLLWQQPGPLTITSYSGSPIMQLPLRSVRVLGTLALIIGLAVIWAIVR